MAKHEELAPLGRTIFTPQLAEEYGQKVLTCMKERRFLEAVSLVHEIAPNAEEWGIMLCCKVGELQAMLVAPATEDNDCKGSAIFRASADHPWQEATFMDIALMLVAMTPEGKEAIHSLAAEV